MRSGWTRRRLMVSKRISTPCTLSIGIIKLHFVYWGSVLLDSLKGVTRSGISAILVDRRTRGKGLCVPVNGCWLLCPRQGCAIDCYVNCNASVLDVRICPAMPGLRSILDSCSTSCKCNGFAEFEVVPWSLGRWRGKKPTRYERSSAAAIFPLLR